MADMFKMVLNDASVQELYSLPYESLIDIKGTSTRCLCITFPVSVQNPEKIRAICEDATKMANIHFYENGVCVRTEADYSVLGSITMRDVKTGEKNEYDEDIYVKIYTAKMVKATSTEEQLLEMTNTIKTLKKSLSDTSTSVNSMSDAVGELKMTMTSINNSLMTDEFDENSLSLVELKAYKIQQSKDNLYMYLESNPITSMAHKGTPGIYSITQEKQNQLMAMIMMASNPATSGSYTPSWNETGKPCTYDWTLEELMRLAADIEAVVRPLISMQQKMEIQINNAVTTEEVMMIDLTFSRSKFTEMSEVNATYSHTPSEEVVGEVVEHRPSVTEDPNAGDANAEDPETMKVYYSEDEK